MQIFKYILYLMIISLLISCINTEEQVSDSEIGLLINKMSGECELVASGTHQILRSKELVKYSRFDTLKSRAKALSINGLEFIPVYTITLELDPNKVCQLRTNFGMDYLKAGAFYEGSVERYCELAFRKTIGNLSSKEIFDQNNITVINPNLRKNTEDSLKHILLNTYFKNISLSIDSLLLPKALIDAIETKKMLEQQSVEYQKQWIKDELERQRKIEEKWNKKEIISK
jgi:hypothetical protein